METTATPKPSLNLTAIIAAAFLVVAIVFAVSNGHWYFVFKAIHVTFAVIWIGGGMLLTILGLMAERRSDPEELATVARQAAMVGQKLFSPAAGVVLLAGIAMMINGSLDWNQFWVSFGLLGFLSSFVVGIGFLAPQSKRVAALIESDGVESAAAQAGIAKILVIARYDIAVLLLVVFDMVLKPFS
ncbi:MAG TPA: DUF2269 family protein [Gaiellaceae bacterium]|nr:DUF2269 family protein [Gaiellaceae bacterium]